MGDFVVVRSHRRQSVHRIVRLMHWQPVCHSGSPGRSAPRQLLLRYAMPEPRICQVLVQPYLQPSLLKAKPGLLTRMFAGCQSNALPSLPWSDWEIDPRDITICRREDGSDYKLGAGAYGTVRRGPIRSDHHCKYCAHSI